MFLSSLYATGGDLPPPNIRDLECIGFYATRFGRGVFRSLAELEADKDTYDQIVSLEISGIAQQTHLGYRGAIERLPPALQSLNVSSCNGLRRFPLCLPVTIRTLVLKDTRIADVPDCSHLRNLELLNLSGSGVSRLVCRLPASLRTLNLDHNKLERIDYDILPRGLASLSVAHNHLREAPPANFRGTVNFHNNAEVGHLSYVQRVIQQEKKNTLYESAQNVHDSTIQESIRKAVDLLLSMHPEEPRIATGLADLVAARIGPDHLTTLESWLACTDLIGTSGATMYDLLERAYVVASLHEHSSELFVRLRQEVVDGSGLCFTGRASRVVNAFSGFVEGVQVRVSLRAELHSRINVVLSRKAANPEMARAELQELLSGFKGKMSDEETDAWMQAFDEEE